MGFHTVTSPKRETTHMNPRISVRIAIVIWVCIMAAISGRVLLAKRSNSVYPIFSTAGAAWRAGEPIYIMPTVELDQYRYAPTIAAGFAVWSLLPPPLAEVLWRLLNVGILLGGVYCWSRWWRPDWNAGIMLLLVIPLAVGGLNNGQCNAMIAGLLLFAQVWFARGNWWASASAITVCVFLKEYPIALGLLLALLEPRRFSPRLAVCLLIGLALPYLLRDVDYVNIQYQAWFTRVFNDDRTLTGVSQSYRDLQQLLFVSGLPLSLRQYRTLEAALALFAAAYVWWNRTQWDRRQAVWACGALATCWMTFAGPATESSTWVIAAPLLAACTMSAVEQGGWRIGTMLASYALFTFAAVIVWFPRWIAGPVHESGIQPFAGLLMTIVTVHSCLRLTTFQLTTNPVSREIQPA
jgi:hypothetical protein